MKISLNCLTLIKKWEGYKPEAYLDAVGIPTIGYGTIRYPDRKKVRLGDKISEAQAEAFLKFEIDKVVENLASILDGIKINQNQFDAIVSLCYNIGVGAFKSSTVLKKLKSGDFTNASKAFELWDKGTINGIKQVIDGLTNRRKDERKLFDKEGAEGTPIEVEESPQDKVTKLEGYRHDDNHFIVALAGNKVVEILKLKNFIKEDIIEILQQYHNAKTFEFAESDKPLPKGEIIEIAGKTSEILKVESPPSLDRSLLIKGVRDDEPGIIGSDVKELQLRLNELGYYSAEIDGIFGKATDEAVRSFQADHFGNPEADGKVGKITWNKLWGGVSNEPKSVGKSVSGRNYLLLTNTLKKDPSGCFKLKLEYFKDGLVKDFIFANSGQPKRQIFKSGKESVPGSYEPLPEGKWRLSNIDWAGGKDVYNGKMHIAGIGPAKIWLTYVPKNGTKRDLIQIHIDWNRNTFPGTAGCVGIYSISDFKRMVQWLRETDPKFMYVDWGLGTVKLPQ